jgi:two-component system sensor histidine kinase TctE
MPKASLQRLLLHRLLGPLLVILVMGSVFAYFFALKAAENVFDLGLMDNAQDLARQVTLGPQGPAISLPESALKMLRENNDDRVTYAAWNEAGQLFSGSTELKSLISESVKDQPLYLDLELAGEPQRALVIHDTQGFFIAVAETLHHPTRLRNQLFTSILLPETLLSLLTLVVVLAGIRMLLAPVRQLRREIAARSPSDLRPLDEKSAPPDLVPIIHAINELLERLSKAFAGYRLFIADASHQLRTPLASLSNQIESAKSHPPAQVEPLLNQLHSTTQRLTHLTNQLLSLARLEHTEQNVLENSTFNLAELIQDVAALAVSKAHRKGVEFQFALNNAQLVKGSRLMLGEMITNLLDNAVRFSPSQGMISVTLEPSAKGPVLRVEDQGPGVPQAELELLGKPFHQASNTLPEGCGLGLAIVLEIARLHEAQVTFSNLPSGAGLRVEVAFS